VRLAKLITIYPSLEAGLKRRHVRRLVLLRKPYPEVGATIHCKDTDQDYIVSRIEDTQVLWASMKRQRPRKAVL